MGEALTPPQKPHRPALRYYGGKFRAADWILSFAPPHRCYCEPFSGAASILLRKIERAPAETINDRDDQVQRFFRTLRDRGSELIEKIRLTPFSRREFEDSRERLKREAIVDDLEHSRLVYVVSWQAMHAGLRPNRTGWRACKGTGRLTSAADEFADLSALPLIVERLRGVQIESDLASKVIDRYDTAETLFVVDPPYPLATRSHRWSRDGYAFELTQDDHTSLLNQLATVRGMVLLCSYRNPAYDDALLGAGWAIQETEVATFAGGKAHEALYINPLAQRRQVQSRFDFAA